MVHPVHLDWVTPVSDESFPKSEYQSLRLQIRDESVVLPIRNTPYVRIGKGGIPSSYYGEFQLMRADYCVWDWLRDVDALEASITPHGAGFRYLIDRNHAVEKKLSAVMVGHRHPHFLELASDLYTGISLCYEAGLYSSGVLVWSGSGIWVEIGVHNLTKPLEAGRFRELAKGLLDIYPE